MVDVKAGNSLIPNRRPATLDKRDATPNLTRALQSVYLSAANCLEYQKSCIV